MHIFFKDVRPESVKWLLQFMERKYSNMLQGVIVQHWLLVFVQPGGEGVTSAVRVGFAWSLLHRFWLPILLLWGDSALRVGCGVLSRVVDQVAPRNKVYCHGTSFVRRFSYRKMVGEGEYPYVEVVVLFH